MKKLSRIKLHDATVLNDNEMKMVVGGSGAGGDKICSRTCVLEKDEDGKPTKTETYTIYCSGECESTTTETYCKDDATTRIVCEAV